MAPNAIRQASKMVATSPLIVGERGRTPDPRSFIDHGNMEFPVADGFEVAGAITEAVEGLQHPVLLGGDHSITYGAVRGLKQRLQRELKRKPIIGIVHFDSHIDMYPDSYGMDYAHASPFYHLMNEKIVHGRNIAQFGIRGGQKDEWWKWSENEGVLRYSADHVARWTDNVIGCTVRQMFNCDVVYLSFDIDAIDPAFAPGTGTPVVAGLSPVLVFRVLEGMKCLPFVGMDIVEVSPPYDHGEITSLLAAQIVGWYMTRE